MKSWIDKTTIAVILISIPILTLLVVNYLSRDDNPDEEIEYEYDFVVGFYIAGESFDSKLIDDDISDTLGLENDKVKFFYLVDYDGPGNTEFFQGNNYTRDRLNISDILPYDADELNLGSVDVFSAYGDFIHSYNAHHHCLMVWGHGKGYEGICFDGSSSLNSTEIYESLADKDFDLIVFDACEMASIEFLYEIRGVSDYVMATEKDLPDRGYDYAGGFSSFVYGEDRDPLALARSLMDSTRSYYDRNPSKYSLQISLIDMEEITDLCDNMLERETFDFTDKPPYYESGKRFDLGLYFDMNGMEDLRGDLNESVAYQVTLPCSSGVDIEGISGISMIDPDKSESIPLIDGLLSGSRER